MTVLSLEQQKLATLCTIEGYEKLDQLMEAAALYNASEDERAFHRVGAADFAPTAILIGLHFAGVIASLGHTNGGGHAVG